MPPFAVHPHTCGDHEVRSFFLALLDGPPPHMWGSLRTRSIRILFRRSTPTHVGITSCASDGGHPPTVHPHTCGDHDGLLRLNGAAQVHPHTCGDHASKNARISLRIGPPPHMWGSPWQPCNCQLAFRSTPTHVGITHYYSHSVERARSTPTHVGITHDN